MREQTPNRFLFLGQCAASAAFFSFVLLASMPVRPSPVAAGLPGPAVRTMAKLARQAFECSQSLTLALPVARRDPASLQPADWITVGELCAGHSHPVSESLHDRAPPLV